MVDNTHTHTLTYIYIYINAFEYYIILIRVPQQKASITAFQFECAIITTRNTVCSAGIAMTAAGIVCKCDDVRTCFGRVLDMIIRCSDVI